MSDALPAPLGADATLAEWAVWNASVGRATGAFKVFPVVPGLKRPLAKGWQQFATDDPAIVARHWRTNPRANIGLAVQPGFVVIDADLYKPGCEPLLDAYEAEHGELPQTLEFKSASGGYHLVYSTDKHLGNGLGTLPRFGDVRGHGGLIVGPGSVFEGKRYEPFALRAPVQLPSKIAGMLVEKQEKPVGERELPPFVQLDDPQNIARYTTWLLSTARPSIEGAGGNNNLAAAGAMGASYALSGEKTLELLIEHFNPRCEPPWDDDEIEKHGGSGYRSASSTFGNMALPNGTLMFAAQSSATNNPEIPGSSSLFLTMQDFAGPAPARMWTIGTDADGWLPYGELTFMFGPGGAGKTALAGQVGLCVARGTPLFGTIPVRQMPVLFVACEDDKAELHRRFVAQGRLVDDKVYVAPRLGQDNALHPPFRLAGAEDTPLYSALDHHLAALPPGPRLLILDNLAQLYMGNYMDPAEIARFLNGYLRRLARKHDLTILMLAHPSEAQKQSGDGSFGGIGWNNGVRSRLYFDRAVRRTGRGAQAKIEEIGDLRILSRKKANYTKNNAGIVLNWENWSFVPAELPVADEDEPAASPAQRTGKRFPEDSIVRRYLDDFLAAHPAQGFSLRSIADCLAPLISQGEKCEIASDWLRKGPLKRLADYGHPLWQNVTKRFVRTFAATSTGAA